MENYDLQVEFLKKHQDKIGMHWLQAIGLFALCGPTSTKRPGPMEFGCPTMVKYGLFDAYSPELTQRIRDDNRIPDDPGCITVDNLGVFAEYQREIDAAIGRVNTFPMEIFGIEI